MANGNSALNVTTGKPKPTGAIWRQRIVPGSEITMPASPTEALDSGWECVGYITEDGVKFGNNIAKDVIKAWGGDIVITNETARGYNVDFSAMESLKDTVQKMAFGDEAVEAKEGFTVIKANGNVGDDAAYVIDRVLKSGKADRIIIPHASITSVGDWTYKDNDVVVYPFTMALIKDENYDDYYDEMIEN